MIEIDESTKRGHERFKAMTSFRCSDGIVRKWSEWMEWQRTRDPLDEMPDEAKKVQAKVDRTMKQEREAAEQALRGPGISKRPRPAKKPS